MTLNRKVRLKPGDSFSKMVLGLHNYFRQVNTSAEAIKREVLDRVSGMELAIGVVAEPEFVEEAGHFDYIFGIAAAVDGIIWNGEGVLNADGQLLLDGEGNCEVMK